MELDGFWDNTESSHVALKTLNQLKQKKETIVSLNSVIESAEAGIELLANDPDDNLLIAEVQGYLNEGDRQITAIELECLLCHEWDTLNCIFSINAGAGGTDAQDWADMLLRMYTRWFDSQGFSVILTDITSGDEAGIKSVTMLVHGNFCYGKCKNEIGIHRLVRQSPFNANAKRQTSFAAVDVSPQFDDSYKIIQIEPNHLRIDTYRASGAGGQHINKTDSAVRITHLPTGIVAQSQAQRSQSANKDTAMKILTARILNQLEQEQKEKIDDLKGSVDIAWGNQIRSYVFHPYKLVKDHRNNTETSNIQQVMDGHLTPFINAQLRHQSKQTLDKL
jgi:peptide chain release factor 2